MTQPHLVDAPASIWRVAIASNGRRYAEIDPASASIPGAGNRFDVPGGGVLYGSTTIEGCFRETLARLRPSPRMRELDEDNDSHFMRAGCIPASWRDARRIFEFSLSGAERFVDVEHQGTRTFFDAVLDPRPDHPLDVSDVRGPDRQLTRAIAAWVYAQVDEDGDGRFAGIRYLSRMGDYECWAVFDGTPAVEASPPRAIELTDPVLLRVAAEYGLVLN